MSLRSIQQEAPYKASAKCDFQADIKKDNWFLTLLGKPSTADTHRWAAVQQISILAIVY